MNSDHGRNITLLRKERCLSQKQAAADLNISQALLSHYEKSIRECSLDFVIRAADYYGVSADFLLGRTSERNGATLDLDDFPDLDDQEDVESKSSSLLPLLSKKIITNVIHMIYSILLKTNNKKATVYVSDYLMLSVYKVFRKLYSSNPSNTNEIFSVDRNLYNGFSSGEMQITEAKLDASLSDTKHKKGSSASAQIDLSPEIIAKEYSQYTGSIYNLIQLAEKKLK